MSIKSRDEWLNEGHSYDKELENARTFKSTASELQQWAERKIAESRPENFQEGVIQPIQERRSNYDKVDGPVITAIKDALKKGKVNVGGMVEVGVDSNNKELPKGQYAIMPFTNDGDYWGVRDLKKHADNVIDDLKKNFKGDIELINVDTGKSIRSYIIQVNESKVNEASRWKGKEIYPNWVKPSDIEGFVKKESDLEVGRDYVFYEPGMDSWQAEYTYKGKIRGEYTFTSSSQFSTAPDERFTRKELDAMIKDLELAVMESESVNERLNSREKNLAEVLADDVGDYLGDTLDWSDWEDGDEEQRAEYVNNALGKISDRYYNDGDFDKDLDKLMNKKYDEVVGFIVKSLSESIVNESLKGKLKALYKAAQKKFGKTKIVPPNDADYETADKFIEMEYGKGYSLFSIGVDKIQDLIHIEVGHDKDRNTEDIVIDRPAENANEAEVNEADWSDDVKTKWTPPKGLFAETTPPNKIADTLFKASKDLDQAMSRLMFYINRGGKLLSPKAKANLEVAKKMLQKKYQ